MQIIGSPVVCFRFWDRPPGSVDQVALEMFTALGMAEFGQRLRLDLADSLAGYTKGSSDFFEGSRPAVVKPKPQTNDFLFAGRELSEHCEDFLAEHFAGCGFGRANRLRIFDEIGEARVLFAPKWSVERQRVLCDLCLLYTSPSPRDRG